MAFGMTYDEFWNGDVEMPKMFRKAHEIRQREIDQQAWLQGAYVYQAIGALAPVLKAFAKGNAKPYLEHPFGYEEKPMTAENPIKAKEQRSDDKARTIFEMWALSFNDKFDQKGGDADGGSDNPRD